MFDRLNFNGSVIVKKIILSAVFLLMVFVFYKLAYFVAPFIIALILASLMEPLIGLMINRINISRKLAAIFSLIIFIGGLGTLLALLISTLIREFISFTKALPKYYAQIEETIDSIIAKGTDIYMWLPDEITDNIGSFISNLSSKLLDILNSIFTGALETAVSLPEALVFLIATILATYFMTSDRDKILDFFIKQLPRPWIKTITTLRQETFSALFGYIKAQLILMSITFAELFIGFNILRIKYALPLAFIISIIDAFPILGTGTVIIPWALYSFITADFRLGVSLVIIYAIVTIVRQMIEPKILGAQIGVYPLLTLAGIYVGLKIFGLPGLILGPITVLLLKHFLSCVMEDGELKKALAISRKIPARKNNPKS